jgi:hypothetical protein
MTYTQAQKQATYRYRAKHVEEHRAMQRIYCTKFYHENAEKVLEYKKKKYQWDKENKYQHIAKTFRKILF